MVIHALLQQVSLRGREEFEAMSGHDFFMSSFEVLHMEIMFTKETGHLYWVSMLRMRIAAIYTEGSAFGGSDDKPPIQY